ncbi:hypothetical protein B5K08_26860 [Rhizobium leguminosarum bv. trifolii]|uniref:Uncharacterized protein n=2 Tax=Rhizobium TaxID=379 RepID=A0A3E1B5T6_RHILT|nr:MULTISPECIES: hypothetical protein [Rhizobium]OWV81654.1 hypothetical protein ATY75_27690 [Rhizobium sp. N122]RFB85246.1 hypothetical protein B5K08_26860 [Rhizobium leguminosarum bv. trifolii]RFB86311.1 hypothetical protein B5K10_25575 [Rhizobium leguminosarum bv. trifolii]
MFPWQTAQGANTLENADLALCQRVFYHLVAARRIKSEAEREELANRILQSFRHGVKDEDALVRLLM